jgi:hypothetical protein
VGLFGRMLSPACVRGEFGFDHVRSPSYRSRPGARSAWHLSFGWLGKSQSNSRPGARLFGDGFPAAPINPPTILNPPISQIIWSERCDDSSFSSHRPDWSDPRKTRSALIPCSHRLPGRMAHWAFPRISCDHNHIREFLCAALSIRSLIVCFLHVFGQEPANWKKGPSSCYKRRSPISV